MDGKAYLSDELWNAMLIQYELNENKLRDTRYDLVIHLSTTADGAEEYYSHLNNEARHESLSFAKKIDKNLIKAWIAHPNFV